VSGFITALLNRNIKIYALTPKQIMPSSIIAICFIYVENENFMPIVQAQAFSRNNNISWEKAST
jgi:hypothetical protein